MKLSNQNAVSPVIGVMLMLVVVIIIAAVVSAFGGGAMGNAQKTPQATIKGVFSQSGGMQIIHTGGDAIPASTLLFVVTNDATFGQGLSAATTQILNKAIITDASGNVLQNTDGTSAITSFTSGQTLYISRDNLNPAYLQPQLADGGAGTYSYSGGVWTSSSGKSDLFKQCYINPDNVGKTFTLSMSDKTSGATIAKTTVVITP
ncbi:type IV pilin N-terminal domain-containing protein [Methanoregula sp.]|uniref:type IV pilin N-terminal domain-containing protein n=1 Tax=Methanoregula sp. TaxID=2052170 RepID=UPI00236D7EBE|nr:type IV pilin N-terminal domain-containing protein [Methanoregula sp.]MDD1687871.1 type IV pilin N-terminal domain-containing protein [Methanoregula sp.]